jgi:hypothetical protein
MRICEWEEGVRRRSLVMPVRCKSGSIDCQAVRRPNEAHSDVVVRSATKAGGAEPPDGETTRRRGGRRGRAGDTDVAQRREACQPSGKTAGEGGEGGRVTRGSLRQRQHPWNTCRRAIPEVFADVAATPTSTGGESSDRGRTRRGKRYPQVANKAPPYAKVYTHRVPFCFDTTNHAHKLRHEPKITQAPAKQNAPT